jgi:hypothetical protein
VDDKDVQIQTLRDTVANLLAQFQNQIVESTFSLQKEVAKLQISLANAEVEVRRLRGSCPRSGDREMMCVKPFWKLREIPVNEDLCFLLMPFRESWSARVWDALVQAARMSGFNAIRADQRQGRLVIEDIWKDLCSAKAVIADLTGSNPNVTYEVGMADVLGKDPIFISQTLDQDKIPFDFLGQRVLKYEASDSGIAKLIDEIRVLLRRSRGKMA